MSERVFAITDIHGCSRTFISLVENVIQLKKEDTLYLLGDYIDRGPDSKGVIDYILQLKESGFKLITLRGNHEAMMLNSMNNRSSSLVFMTNGGDATLNSFGVTYPNEIENVYLNFFDSLEYFSVYKNFILVHAGLNFNHPDPLEDKESMLWIRQFKVSPAFSDKIIVHGHTPTSLMDIQESFSLVQTERKICIDNGCVYGLNEFYGNLCCLELNSLTLYIQPNIDLKPQF